MAPKTGGRFLYQKAGRNSFLQIAPRLIYTAFCRALYTPAPTHFLGYYPLRTY